MNPHVVKVMQERGIDLSGEKTQGVSDLLKKGSSYDAVITVCDEASAERCPVFPGGGKRIAWSFEDPSSFKGNPEEMLHHTRLVRDQIEAAVKTFISEYGADHYWN